VVGIETYRQNPSIELPIVRNSKQEQPVPTTPYAAKYMSAYIGTLIQRRMCARIKIILINWFTINV
jgi:hypothetical protein